MQGEAGGAECNTTLVAPQPCALFMAHLAAPLAPPPPRPIPHQAVLGVGKGQAGWSRMVVEGGMLPAAPHCRRQDWNSEGRRLNLPPPQLPSSHTSIITPYAITTTPISSLKTFHDFKKSKAIHGYFTSSHTFSRPQNHTSFDTK